MGVPIQPGVLFDVVRVNVVMGVRGKLRRGHPAMRVIMGVGVQRLGVDFMDDAR